MSVTRKEEDNRSILHKLHSLLVYQAHTGIRDYPLTDNLQRFLHSRYAPASADPQRNSESGYQRDTAADLPGAALTEHPGTVGEISREVEVCKRCGLAEKRVIAAGGSGGDKVRLFVVGSWLVSEEGDRCSGGQGCVFGAEEDEMLRRMMAAIKLSAEEVFVSNIVKCGIGPQVQPQVEHIDACISYLERQIVATRPEIICVMGIAAARTLLKIRRPLSSIRGKVHEYRLGETNSIPAVPTYHPSFLLKNPEMKKATWADLQLIEKKLRGL